MEMIFKSLKRTKDGLHQLNYHAVEKRGDADIKTTYSITLEDTDIVPSESLESIIAKCQDIAVRLHRR